MGQAVGCQLRVEVRSTHEAPRGFRVARMGKRLLKISSRLKPAPAQGPPRCCPEPQPPNTDPLLHPRALVELFSHARQLGALCPVLVPPPSPTGRPHTGTLWLKGWHSSPSCPRGVHIRSPRSQRLTAQQVPLPHCGSRSQAWGEGRCWVSTTSRESVATCLLAGASGETSPRQAAGCSPLMGI